MAEPSIKQISSATGWNALTKVWAHVVPTQLYVSQQARRGIRSLIRTGR